MGITSEQIRDPNLKTASGVPLFAPTRKIEARDPDTGKFVTHSEAKSGGVWRKIERELGQAIERAAKEGLDLDGLIHEIDKIYKKYDVRIRSSQN